MGLYIPNIKMPNACGNCVVPLSKCDYLMKRADECTLMEIDLVKCRECKYSKEWYGDRCLCYLWSEMGIGVFEDGYCSYGKRRADEDI